MFDVDEFVAECHGALAESEPRNAIRELLERTIAAADDVAATLQPFEGDVGVLYGSAELTVVHAVWAPGMDLYPHDHRMWAAIGVYAGREDNTFFRRPAPADPTLVESGGRDVTAGEVLLLGDDAIHSVANTSNRLTAAIHVYGGDFVHQPRSQWGPGERVERPFDLDEARRQFALANAAWHATSPN
jgi:predicted metal-dependent enzyme (double-stranded beta helix superfamily)